jgi:hypothetical protein
MGLKWGTRVNMTPPGKYTYAELPQLLAEIQSEQNKENNA